MAGLLGPLRSGRRRTLPLRALLSLTLLGVMLGTSRAQDTASLGFMLARNEMILANLPTTGDRNDRLQGKVNTVSTPEPFMKALPGIMSGTPIPLNASLAAVDKMSGNRKPRLYDLWIKGRANLAAEPKPGQRLGIVSSGIDFLVHDRLLLGGFAQADSMASTGLAGWSLGGFGTARITDNLYLDFLGARGGAEMDGVGNAANWLMTTAVNGKWTADQWTFGPQARVSYFAALAPGGNDPGGVVSEAQRRATSELAIGPSVSYKLTTVNNVLITTGLKFDTVAKLSVGDASDLALDGWRSGLEGTLNIDLPSGTRWKSSFGYQGIGADKRSFNATGTLTVPLR